MVEEKTPLAEKVAQKSCILPNEDEMADMEELTEQVLAGDFHRYEISNYARKGHECRHNIQYWRNRPYLGAGAGAVSFLNGIRIANVADPGLFSTLVARHSLPVASMESLYYADSIEIALGKIYKLLKPGGKFFCGTDFYTDNKATAKWSKMMKISAFSNVFKK